MLAVLEPSFSYCRFQGRNSGKQNQREKFKTINNVQTLIITKNPLSYLNNSYVSHKTLHDLLTVLISPTWAIPVLPLFLLPQGLCLASFSSRNSPPTKVGMDSSFLSHPN